MRLEKLTEEMAHRVSGRMDGALFRTVDPAVLFSGRSSDEKLTIRDFRTACATVITCLARRGYPEIALTEAEAVSRSVERRIPDPVRVSLPDRAVDGGFFLTNSPAALSRPVRVFSHRLIPRWYPPVAWAIWALLAIAAALLPGKAAVLPVVPAVALLFRRSWSYWFIRYLLDAGLLALSASILVLAPRAVRWGVSSGSATWIAALLIALVIIVQFRRAWRRDDIAWRWRTSTVTPDALAGMLLRPGERLRLLFPKSAVLSIMLIAGAGWWLAAPFQSTRFIPLKASLATAFNSPVTAWRLYDSTPTPGSAEKRAAALAGSIAAYVRNRDFDAAFALIIRLPEMLDRMPESARARLPALVFTCADTLATYGSSAEQWRRAETLLGFLVSAFPGSAAARQAVERSRWRLVSMGRRQMVHRFPSSRVPVDLRAEMENSVIWQSAPAGSIFLLQDVELAHLGSRGPDLLNTMIRMKTPDGPARSIRGFFDRNGLHRVHSLETTGSGPDIVPLTLVMEVPAQSRSLILKLGGGRNYTIDYDPAAVTEFPDMETLP